MPCEISKILVGVKSSGCSRKSLDFVHIFNNIIYIHDNKLINEACHFLRRYYNSTSGECMRKRVRAPCPLSRMQTHTHSLALTLWPFYFCSRSLYSKSTGICLRLPCAQDIRKYDFIFNLVACCCCSGFK